ncbi:MAG: DegV family protein [Eubacteriales bacterium]
MSRYVITTETNSEIPWKFAKEHAVPFFRMPYTVEGVEADYDLGENTDFIAFFTKLKDGAQAATSTKSPFEVEQFFRTQLDKGLDVLHLGFSSQLSAHFSICKGCLETLRADYPKQRIEMIDTMRISMPMGLIVMEAVEMMEAGKSFQDVYDWVQVNKLRAQGWFTVDDLMYLKRGGRLSGTAAVLGTMLEVKPVLILDDMGKIVVHDKIKGRKNVIKYLEKTLEENIGDPAESNVTILHAMNLEMAENLKERLEKFATFKSLWIQDIGPVIGSHTGPGVLAVCFLKKA